MNHGFQVVSQNELATSTTKQFKKGSSIAQNPHITEFFAEGKKWRAFLLDDREKVGEVKYYLLIKEDV